jgi:crotonobetainyl-CoA:carnitine CoA-transferase CaiB-like acyl-CoA transferase
VNSLLRGVTVLDFSEYIAGPYCGSLLADLGARVIKIEPPDGAEERRIGTAERYRGNTRMSLAFNRGKESLSVDLRQQGGRDIVYALVRKADVVLQNFVPPCVGSTSASSFFRAPPLARWARTASARASTSSPTPRPA